MAHQPPEWALNGGERVDLDGFLEAFREGWERTERCFLKLECWQSYQEADGIRSQDAYQRGDTSLARRLLEEEAMDDQPLRDDVKARNLDFTRVRLLSLPLTDYLHYEMINYEVRGRLGAHIEFLKPPSPVEKYFDFLLFDSHTALIYDYGPGPVGHQVGGWLTRHPKTLRAGRHRHRYTHPRRATEPTGDPFRHSLHLTWRHHGRETEAGGSHRPRDRRWAPRRDSLHFRPSPPVAPVGRQRTGTLVGHRAGAQPSRALLLRHRLLGITAAPMLGALNARN